MVDNRLLLTKRIKGKTKIVKYEKEAKIYRDLKGTIIMLAYNG